MIDAAVMEKLEEGFKELADSVSASLLKKHLTQELFDKLKNKTTNFGSTLLDCVQSGLENHDSEVGIYAPDPDAYSVFSELFDPIIEEYHDFKKTDMHPPKNWGNLDDFGNVDPSGDYVVYTRLRCSRSLEGYPFCPGITEEQLLEIEERMSNVLNGFTGELKGSSYTLLGKFMNAHRKLIVDHLFFKDGDRFLQAANAYSCWPNGRAFYINDNKTFLVWYNKEDHLRLTSMQIGGNMGQVYRRLVTAIDAIEEQQPYSHDDRLGYLTLCPQHLGTTIRAAVHMKIPELADNYARLEEVADKHHLHFRPITGDHIKVEDGCYAITNKRRMGMTEYDVIKEVYDGIADIINVEKELETS